MNDEQTMADQKLKNQLFDTCVQIYMYQFDMSMVFSKAAVKRMTKAEMVELVNEYTIPGVKV